MKLKVLNNMGNELRTVDAPSELLVEKNSDGLMHTVLKSYRANKRQGTHASKTRSNVSGGGKKPFKQKGTGSARQGSSRSPLMEGGGISHGPQPRNYHQSVNRKVRKQALVEALSEKIKSGSVFLLDELKQSEYSTKKIVDLIESLKIKGRKALFLDSGENGDFLYRSARNIHKVDLKSPIDMNAEDILRHDFLVMSESTLNQVQERLR